MDDDLPRDSDGDALRRLIATGSDLSKAMEIDFAMDVPDQVTGLAFASAAEALGYRTSVNLGNASGRWTCYCTRTMVPSHEAVIEVQKNLEKLGKPYNAVPDGWGSFGNATE